MLPVEPYVDSAGVASMIVFIAESDPTAAKIKPNMVMNHWLVKKLADIGFIDQLGMR